MSKITVFWHRRDLRLHDNAGLFHALKSGLPVLPIFIFDREILDKLEDKKDRRVEFIWEHVGQIGQQLQNHGSSIWVKHGSPVDAWRELLDTYEIDAVYTNHDYEPYAKDRDQLVAEFLQSEGISFHSYKDQCIFERSEVVKKDGLPYTVFTPFSRKWHEKLNIKETDFYVRPYPTEQYFGNFFTTPILPIPSLGEMGFEAAGEPFPEMEVQTNLIQQYQEKRNFPAVKGTSRLSVHLRFGTISIRELARKGLEHSSSWLNELVWRDFYMMILEHFPDVVTQNFNRKYDAVQWRNNEEEFQAWCDGKTGYPIVDAGMRELNETGFMHNRVRMITASFLTKHLLVDWRWGEAYFAQKLLDFELASNNGGWQWAAGTGTDAQPYFRVFNPYSQTDKFDKDKRYIKKWIPEYGTPSYPVPIVEHKAARERALDAYKIALGKV